MTAEAELEALRAKVKAREGKAGFGENVRQMKERIAELEKGNAGG